MKSVLLIFLYGVFSQAAFGYADIRKSNREEDGNTKLHLAIMAEKRRGHNDQKLKKTVQALLQGGEDPNVTNSEEISPLYLSISYPETFKVLLQYGADPNISDSDGETDFQKIINAMFFYQGKLFYVNSIFKWSQIKPNVNVENEDGNSILNNYLDGFIARMSEKLSEITNLNQEAYNTKGYDARSEKLKTLKYEQERYIEEYKAGTKTAFILINKGADLTHRNARGELPLHQAVQLPGSEVTEQMIKKRGTGYLTRKDRAVLVQRAVWSEEKVKQIRLLQRKQTSLKVKLQIRSSPVNVNWNGQIIQHGSK